VKAFASGGWAPRFSVGQAERHGWPWLVGQWNSSGLSLLFLLQEEIVSCSELDTNLKARKKAENMLKFQIFKN
jgi:hypothetical protein